MPIISVFLSYVGGLSLLYHASIGIYLKKSQIQLYESYPTPVDFYSNILMKWLCFMLYLCIEDFLLIIFEIIPLGAWVLLMFKLYLISPRSEVHLKLFKRTFSYIEFQDEFLNISFYGSLISKHMIIGFLKLNMKLMKGLSSQHLEEIEYLFADTINVLNVIKVKAIQNAKSLELKQEKEKEEENFQKVFLKKEEIQNKELIRIKSEEKVSKQNNCKELAIPQANYEYVVKSQDFSIDEEKYKEEEEVKKTEKKTKKTNTTILIKEKEKSKDAPIKKTKTVTKKTTKKDQSGSEDKDKESNEKPKDVVKKTDKKDQSKENEDKEKEKNEKPKEKESKESKERKRFIEAGVFEADVSVQTKEGSKLNPDLYQEFKALVILPEKNFILKNLDKDEEFLRKPLKELKMISNVTLLIKVVYYLDELDKSASAEVGHYSMKLKSKNDYEEWFLPVSLFLQRDQFI